VKVGLILFVRKAVEIAYEHLVNGHLPLIVAPTSYGKTLGSIYILDRASKDLLAPKLIHTVPLRALVGEIYLEKFKSAGVSRCISTGYQMHDKLDGGDKSPYFLRDLVVTTLDSYLWNMLRIPVAEYTKVLKESSRGHYYPVLASIYNSVNVFDEAHLYIGDYIGSIGKADVIEIVYATLSTLVEHMVPCVVETATIHTNVIQDLEKLLKGKLVVVYETCEENIQVKKLKELNIPVETTCDQSFHSMYSDIVWRTHLIRENEALNRASDFCDKGFKVLFVRNTIGKALETYEKLLGKGCKNIFLLHSLIGLRDREHAFSRFSELLYSNEGAILVSTQVVEHGVTLEADVLITDVAPMENLAQRVGRLCRDKKREQCRKHGVDIFVIEPEQINSDKGFFDVYSVSRVYSALDWLKNTISSLGNEAVEWRLLESVDKQKSFVEGVEHSEPPHVDQHRYSFFRSFIDNYLESEAPQSLLYDVAREYGSSFMQSFMVKLAPKTDRGFDLNNYVLISIDQLISYETKLKKQNPDIKCLHIDDDKIGILILYVSDKEPGLKTYIEYVDGHWWMKIARSGLRQYLSFLELEVYRKAIDKLYKENGSREISIIDYYLLLNKDCYYKNGSTYGAYHIIKRRS